MASWLYSFLSAPSYYLSTDAVRSLNLPKHRFGYCWSCAIKNKHNTGFDELRPQAHILMRYALDYYCKITISIEDMRHEDYVAAALARNNMVPELAEFLYAVQKKGDTREQEIVFVCCAHCKAKIAHNSLLFFNCATEAK